jgi:hypothetical protein
MWGTSMLKPVMTNPLMDVNRPSSNDPWTAPTLEQVEQARAQALGREQAERQREAELLGKEKAWEEQAYKDSLLPAMPPGRRRAEGGPVNGGEPYLVGEEGPEIVMPWEDGMVVPNQQSDAMLDGLMKMLKQRYGV